MSDVKLMLLMWAGHIAHLEKIKAERVAAEQDDAERKRQQGEA